MSRTHRTLMAFIVVLTIALSFQAGRRFQQASAMQVSPSPQASMVTGLAVPRAEPKDNLRRQSAVSEHDLIEDVWRTVTAHYVERLDSRSAETKLAYGAARGLLAALGDPYTRFMEPDEYDDFQRETEGHFDGIGATITMLKVPVEPDQAKRLAGVTCPLCGGHFFPENWRVAVQSPLPGSPAAKAGLRPHDFILAIDGMPTEGMDLNSAVKLIRGPAGKSVRLKIGRQGLDGPIEKTIIRGVITVPNVEVKAPRARGDIGVITIRTFNEQAADAVTAGLEQMKKDKASALVIDLRNCTGGLLRSALDIAREFIPTGPILQVQERGQPRRPEPPNPKKPGEAPNLPIAVLVNGGTASAAEILAGAIQDDKKGFLVGERTFGKGLVQTVVPMRDGSAVVVTTAKYFTPSGRDINRSAKHPGGIVPDEVVPFPKDLVMEDVRLTDRDPQYARAVKSLRSKITLRAAAK